MSLYPPFLFGGVRVVWAAPDFSGCRVRVRRGLLNWNLNRTVFGGTLYSAADPIYVLLFWQHFAHRDLALRVWTHSARIQFLAPVRRHVELRFEIDAALLARADAELQRAGKFVEALAVQGLDPEGQVAVEIETVVHLAHLFPNKGVLSHDMKTRMTVSAQGQQMSMGMTMKLGLDMARE